ncbi:TetR/AcrR family transcriptional regulator [Virgibacillus proomii]|uniref:TetR/AcrR family transcriptional regulator n=1 Tax=Virgibacillus proomii TaxID=84407 RepID=UPI001C1196C1|nr:TetR/AcrR family transcriptional regulator [Virgibacillus proomii]MBU5267965.1 TetR/AcrR family transcriptional regulator [Virgibacillus proomii]
MQKDSILSSIKDQSLIEKRRNQIIRGAITLFKDKGFHRTTTREIAKAAGFSIGTLYEYIRTKEDVLFLVCDSIYLQVRKRLEAQIDLNNSSVEHFTNVIRSYFYLMDEMQEEVLIMYQEVKSLKNESKEYVLKKEWDMLAILERLIATSFPDSLSLRKRKLLANNIFIIGQMWAFRRWMLQKQFTLEEYTDYQIHFLMNSIKGYNESV